MDLWFPFLASSQWQVLNTIDVVISYHLPQVLHCGFSPLLELFFLRERLPVLFCFPLPLSLDIVLFCSASILNWFWYMFWSRCCARSWPVFCHLIGQDYAYGVLLQIEVWQNCLWCTFNCTCCPGSFQEVGLELDFPSTSTVIHDSLDWISSHFPHGTPQLDVGIAPNHVTHVVWNPAQGILARP